MDSQRSERGMRWQDTGRLLPKSALHREKRGTLRSGKGGKVTRRKQAIAIGLSEARKKVAKAGS